MGILPKTGPSRKDISCEKCTAACCRAGMTITLTPREAIMNAIKIRRTIHIEAAPFTRTVRINDPEIHEGTIEAMIPPNTEVA